MNGQGGCCIAKYGGGGGTGEGLYGMSKVDRIMLKFRPIAPKPVTAGSGSGGSGADNSDGYVKCARSKRKYVRVKKSKNDSFKKRGVDKKMKMKKMKETSVVTLPLLPETPDRKENEPVTGFCSDLSSPVQIITSFQDNKKKPSPPVPPVVSYVTVESVTDTWVDSEELGCTDEEIMLNMEKDTCPGFISDDQDKVVWMNTAYKHMVEEDDIAVVLVRKDKNFKKPVTNPVFTCKVRLTYAAQSCRKTGSPALTLPCDVWRMKVGTWAWRLDVKAALSLGR